MARNHGIEITMVQCHLHLTGILGLMMLQITIMEICDMYKNDTNSASLVNVTAETYELAPLHTPIIVPDLLKS